MAYRLPTNLGSLIPPPAEQVQQRRPWQGIITVTFTNTAQGMPQDVYVTAAETDGECRMDLWPRRFYVYLGSRRIPPNDIKAWVKRYPPPICALMADKLPDPTANALNQTNFANLSRMVLEGQMLGLAPWGLDNLPGAGMMIYPTSSSSSLLVGAIFLTGPFPDFATYQQQPARPNPQNPVLGSSSHHQYPYGGHHGSSRYPAP
ncbi:hypothetical protein DFH94DRAFT_313699 [Russula ochroleuca]|jgi:hypothetical protein|uniref:Uncharacterized protein n=1 Tax=Russula ochroleuca TaxID=152965 RepID=A0A9P5N103_9AGAM|nr:hypothetical protein DFH94DRAFT_313699 [Russula ochroleuca]